MADIFLSYRRKDGEAIAYLLYKDLTKSGYTVFFDHKNLGQGDFKQAIEEQIKDAKCVLLILSESSFSEKIFEKNDVYRKEIECAFKYKKRLTGVMLEEFPGFPENLPKEIEAVREYNYVKLYIAYYEAMFNRLVSGNFLPLPTKSDLQMIPSDEAIRTDIPKELLQMSQMTNEQKMQQTQLLLKLMESFNDSEICMRFYRYIDLYDRKRGVSKVPDYDGDIPTDLVTYLSFFETLYIIIGSETMQLSILDFAYRFRFFAGCNIPIMQESELLPLGYQYPNILALYNRWCNYIVEQYDHSVKCDSINNEIPLYDYDLHKRYAAYCFAKKPTQSIKMRFLNRYLIWLNLTMKKLDVEELQTCMVFQDEMLSTIEGNDEKNIFEPLTEKEMRTSLEKDYCIGLFLGEKLVAQMNLILEPTETENLVLDLAAEFQSGNSAIIDYIAVSEEVRGYSIQKTLLFVAEFFCKNNDKKDICAVTSPYNTHSIKNFLAHEYKIVATQPKYRSVRHYLLKKLEV